MKQKRIEEKIYKKILENIPIPCIDAVIVHNHKFLLVKRKNEPAKHQWWLIGGRIVKNETLKQALARKVKEETNLRIKKYKLLTAQETIFKTSHFGVPVHTVNIAYLVEPKSIDALRLDSQSLKYKWFSATNPKWHPYIKMAIHLAGFK